jgi:hypothetical protein
MTMPTSLLNARNKDTIVLSAAMEVCYQINFFKTLAQFNNPVLGVDV